MRCPLCDVSMREVDRRGVRIDVCPECRGVWLDRGELDKLLSTAAREEREFDYVRGSRYDRDDKRGYRLDDDRHYGHKKRRTRSWLEDMFDFGD